MPEDTGIGPGVDYSLKRWAALTRYLGDGRLPTDDELLPHRWQSEVA